MTEEEVEEGAAAAAAAAGFGGAAAAEEEAFAGAPTRADQSRVQSSLRTASLPSAVLRARRSIVGHHAAGPGWRPGPVVVRRGAKADEFREGIERWAIGAGVIASSWSPPVVIFGSVFGCGAKRLLFVAICRDLGGEMGREREREREQERERGRALSSCLSSSSSVSLDDKEKKRKFERREKKGDRNFVNFIFLQTSSKSTHAEEKRPPCSPCAGAGQEEARLPRRRERR